MVVFGKMRPEDPQTEGMVHNSRDQALRLMTDIFNCWEPSHQAWPINHGSKIAAVAAAIPGIILTFKFRKMLGISRVPAASTMSYATLVPSVLIPAVISGFLHEFRVKDDILLQETECSVCVDMRSSLIQLAGGSVMSTIIPYGGAVLTAQNFNLRISPAKLSGWVPITRVIFSKISHYLIGFLLLQLAVSAALVRAQYDCRDEVLSEIETRFLLDKERKEYLSKKLENKLS